MGGRKDLEPFLVYLKELFPVAECALIFNNPFQLIVATILSAQCTDNQVNKVTPKLFAAYPDAESMAIAPIEEIEKLIYSTGFYKNKAKNIKAMAESLVKYHGGVVPADMDKLTVLPGVGRKTANVVLGNAFNIPGMVVDTHVKRITNRYGLTKNQDPEKIEQDLMKIIPKERWTEVSHELVLFGRAICDAKKPKCKECEVSEMCPSSMTNEKNILKAEKEKAKKKKAVSKSTSKKSTQKK